MASERSCSASGDGPQHAELLVTKPGTVLFSKAVALNAEDVGHLHGRPRHLIFFPVILAGCLGDAGQLQMLQRIRHCLQVSLR